VDPLTPPPDAPNNSPDGIAAALAFFM